MIYYNKISKNIRRSEDRRYFADLDYMRGVKGEKMKRLISVFLVFCMMTVFTAGCGAQPQSGNAAGAAVITLQIGNTMMSVDGSPKEIDPGSAAVPVIENGRTLLPVRAVVEAMGGTVEWDGQNRTAALTLGDMTILLTVGSDEAFLNETAHTLDTAPVVINDRTMLPIRFIAEGFGYNVGWDEDTRTVTLSRYEEETEEIMNKIAIEVNGHTLTATLEENTSARALAELLHEGALTIEMSDYGDFEKVGSLGTTLPRKDEQITTQAGDLILYQGNQITIYYDTNSWNFTRLGTIDDITQDELEEILGDGDVTVTLSIYGAQQAADNPGNFDFETKSVLLNSGYEMPIVGLGTYSLSDEECYDSVTALLESGGRLIDTAYMYHNEESVGRAVRDSGVPREEIFVITKLYPSQFSEPEAAIEEALEKLDIGYIDLMLLHHPGTGDVEAYHAMEEAVSEGKIRSIGLSNWYVEELEEFLPQVNITPALVQNEIHPYYQENDVIPYIQSLGITVQGWYPFGGRGHTAELLGDATINDIAEAHGVTAAQVILRWNLQKGVVVIPGSSNPEHIRENLDVFGFELTDEEMQSINALDRGEKHDWY